MTEGRILKGIEFAPPATGDGSHPLLLDLYLPASGRRVPTATSCVRRRPFSWRRMAGWRAILLGTCLRRLRPDAF